MAVSKLVFVNGLLVKKGSMSEKTEREQIKKWVETWNRAGFMLKKIKRRELREFDYARHAVVVDEMLQWAHDNRKIRFSSGLVEQQKLFMKMK